MVCELDLDKKKKGLRILRRTRNKKRKEIDTRAQSRLSP